MAVKIIWLLFFGSLFFVNATPVGTLTTFTSGTAIKASEVNANFTAVKTAVDDNASNISSLSTSLTAAQSTISGHSTSIGSLSGLTTTDKSSLVSALNEVKSGAPSLDGTGKISLAVIPATVALVSSLSDYVTQTALSTALSPYATDTDLAALQSDTGSLSGDNAWSGGNSFAGGSLRLPNSSTCDAAAEGDVSYDSAQKNMYFCTGSTLRTPGVQRYSASGTLSNGQTLTINFGTTVSAPAVTVWKSLGGGTLQMVVPDTNFPVTFNGSQVVLTNNSGGTVDLSMVAMIP